MKKIIFLDFDGVLFNTVKEAYATSMLAIGRYKTLKEIYFESEHYKRFLKYRYLIAPAWNYKYILKLLDSGNKVDFENKYKDAIKKANKNEYEEFENSFFATREYLKQTDFTNWLRLNEPYEFLYMVKLLIEKQQNKFMIITTKDKATVQKLLLLEGIDFNDESIYDRKDFEKYTNKANIIKKIMVDRKIEKAIFVDDSKKHLEDCKNIDNLILFQANWGYISQTDTNVLSKEYIFEELKRTVS